MSEQNTTVTAKNYFPWGIMILMSSVTFVGILSELMPSGVLPIMMQELHLSEIQGGNLVGYYALASAIFSIPLISATMHYNRKVLLLLLLGGFAVSNVIVALVSSYFVIISMRVVGGICAGIMWPMIAAYGMRLVAPEQYGKAVAVIMAGTTLGISLGMPLMTWIGDNYGWRTEFVVIGLIIVGIAVLSMIFLPSLKGEKLTQDTSPFAMLKIKAVLMVLLFTLLGVAAHYGVYVYIASLVESMQMAGGIEIALVMFGIGSLLSVLIAIKYTDEYLQLLTILMFALLIIAMAIFLVFGGSIGIAHFGFFLWGVSFGPLVALFQTAVGRQVEKAKDIATSIQSCTFNLSIMIAASVCGILLTKYLVMSLPVFAIALAVPGLILAFVAKKTLS
ncbi:Predicted arabinose efflux permease, MFS family [Saccharicrinis carchari]|uniref:Predicted arabinose efflux permease, MFS family n=1 Tax=Saccharicrinis carchari TaxID=1168039 RepID=A0A521AZR1_SACCC|nr:MFS transporter [Saccharicrinis carchari]SMO40327.1 Predicted arabinose efflux permease, MFS family [Saccharicrinis carchari]